MSDSSSPSSELSPQKTYRLMAGMAIAMMILIGIAIYSLSHLNSTPWTSSLKPPVIQAGPVRDLPPVQFSNEGKVLNAETFDGKMTLLTFWSTTCAPCMEELPTLNQLALNWPGPEFAIVTVNLDHDENLDQAKHFLEEEQILLPTIFDAHGVLQAAFEVHEFPRHFLINSDHKIVWSATGAFKWNDPKARDQLLKLMEQQTQEAPDSTPDSAE